MIEIIPKLVPSHRGHKVSFDKSDKVICIETYKVSERAAAVLTAERDWHVDPRQL